MESEIKRKLKGETKSYLLSICQKLGLECKALTNGAMVDLIAAELSTVKTTATEIEVKTSPKKKKSPKKTSPKKTSPKKKSPPKKKGKGKCTDVDASCDKDEICNATTGRCVADASRNRKDKVVLDVGGRIIVGDESTISGLQKILGGSIISKEGKKEMSPPKRVSPKKVSPKKVSPKRPSPPKRPPPKKPVKRVSPKRVSPKKFAEELEEAFATPPSSPKRPSPKRKSPSPRKSPKRGDKEIEEIWMELQEPYVSPKRPSPKRKSPKREEEEIEEIIIEEEEPYVSPKRPSPKRPSPKKVSPKKSSPRRSPEKKAAAALVSVSRDEILKQFKQCLSQL